MFFLFPIFRTFLGDFPPDGLDSRSLQTLWEWENRVLLGEYYIFNVLVVPVVLVVLVALVVVLVASGTSSSTSNS
mgnify:CR=1 FL=1